MLDNSDVLYIDSIDSIDTKKVSQYLMEIVGTAYNCTVCNCSLIIDTLRKKKNSLKSNLRERCETDDKCRERRGAED